MGDENPIHTLGDYSRPSHEGYRNTIKIPNGKNVDPNQNLKDFLKLVDSLDLDVANKEKDAAAKLHNDILMFQQHQGESLSEEWTPTRRTIDHSASGKVRDRNAEESWPLLEDVALYDNESWNDPRDFAKPVKAISLPQDTPSTSDRRIIELESQVQRLMEAHLAPKSYVQVNKITSLCEICNGPHDTQYCMENLEQAFLDYASSRTDKAGGKWFTFKPEQNNIGNTYIPSWKSHPNLKWRSELTYHKYLMSGPIPSFFRNPIIVEGYPSNLKIPCNIRHVHVEKAHIDLNSPVNVMTCIHYNWIMRKQLEPREDLDGIRRISNFTERIKGMHIFVGNFTYVSDFMIVEDISSIIDPRLSQVVLGKLFVKISNMTHDLSLGVVKFIDGTNEIAYKIPHKIEQYNSLSDLEKEHTESVYLRNEKDKKRGVDYVMSKILGFYKECLELGPEYLTGLEDEGGVT
ncbi:hypothetical protein Tco_0158769 [Tanacetum coccineum]